MKWTLPITEEYSNELAIALISKYNNFWPSIIALLYFFTFYFLLKIFFKNNTYMYLYYLILGFINLWTLLIFFWAGMWTWIVTFIIIWLFAYSQQETFQDIYENIKLQKVENEKFAMIMQFSHASKTDIDAKINNQSTIELFKEDYRLALEKIFRNMRKIANENLKYTIILMVVNIINLIILISIYYVFYARTEFFAS